MRRVPLVVLCLLALLVPAPSAPAGVTAGFVLGWIGRVRGIKKRHARSQRLKREKELRERVDAVTEKMRSPYEDERREGTEELAELARLHRDREIRLQGTEKLGVLFERMLRDPSWRIRWDARRGLTYLGLRGEDEPALESAVGAIDPAEEDRREWDASIERTGLEQSVREGYVGVP